MRIASIVNEQLQKPNQAPAGNGAAVGLSGSVPTLPDHRATRGQAKDLTHIIKVALVSCCITILHLHSHLLQFKMDPSQVDVPPLKDLTMYEQYSTTPWARLTEAETISPTM